MATLSSIRVCSLISSNAGSMNALLRFGMKIGRAITLPAPVVPPALLGVTLWLLATYISDTPCYTQLLACLQYQSVYLLATCRLEEDFNILLVVRRVNAKFMQPGLEVGTEMRTTNWLIFILKQNQTDGLP